MISSSNDYEDDFVEDDFQPDEPADDFVEDDFTPDEQTIPQEPDKKKRSGLEKSGRVVGQAALGIAESTLPSIALDVATLPAASSSRAFADIQQRIAGDVEDLYLKKYMGDWTEEDQKQLEALQNQYKDTAEIEKQAEASTVDLSTRGLIEKSTGVDTHPEGILEKASYWLGSLWKSRGGEKLIPKGATAKEVIKNAVPYPAEVVKAMGAATAWEMAEDNQFGPMGTIATSILGYSIGAGTVGATKAAMNPKKAIADLVNLATMNNTKKQIASQLAEDFSSSGLKIDAGTLTGSPLVQMIQTRLSQSGLTGQALDNFRKELTAQIFNEYDGVMKQIGELTFENSSQASSALKESLQTEKQRVRIPGETLKQDLKSAPSLEGRIAVEERPRYQEALLDSISPEETTNSYRGGELIKTASEDIRAPIKEEFQNRWDALDEQLAPIQAGPQRELVNSLERFVENNRGSLLLGESAAEARVFTSAERLLNELRPEGGLAGVSLDSLIKTKRTLSDIVNWEMATSDFRSSYKHLVNEVDNAIQRTLSRPQYKDLRNEFLSLNADYSNFKNTFENRNLKNVYNPKNHNYNSIYKEFSQNPDKLKAIEPILQQSPEGQRLLNQIKRDFAEKATNSPNLSARDIRELREALGPEFDGQILNYVGERQAALENPLQRPLPQEGLPVRPQATPSSSSTLSPGRISETGTKAAADNLKAKYLDKIKKAEPAQIMRKMDSVDGIRELRKVLSSTPEDRELFKQLSRFKIAELIDAKMADSVTEQVKLGRFARLLDNSKTRDIVKELMPSEAYNRLQKLQKNSGKLAEASGKFFNSSQSGTSVIDMGLVGSAATGVLLGNPFLAVPAIFKIGGSYVLANLLSDPGFLKELEKSIKSPPKKFNVNIKAMRPYLRQAQEQLSTE